MNKIENREHNFTFILTEGRISTIYSHVIRVTHTLYSPVSFQEEVEVFMQRIIPLLAWNSQTTQKFSKLLFQGLG